MFRAGPEPDFYNLEKLKYPPREGKSKLRVERGGGGGPEVPYLTVPSFFSPNPCRGSFFAFLPVKQLTQTRHFTLGISHALCRSHMRTA